MTAGSSRRDPAAWCLCPRATTPGLSATRTSCSSTGTAQRTTQSRPPPPDRSFNLRALVAFPRQWGLLVVHHLTMAGWRGRIMIVESWEHCEAPDVHGDGPCYLGRPLMEISGTSTVRVALVGDSVEELLGDEGPVVMTFAGMTSPAPIVSSRLTGAKTSTGRRRQCR